MANHQSHTAGGVRLHAESRGMCKSSPAGALTVNSDYKMYNMSVVLAGLCKKMGENGKISTKPGGGGNLPRNNQLNFDRVPGIFILRGLLGFC